MTFSFDNRNVAREDVGEDAFEELSKHLYKRAMNYNGHEGISMGDNLATVAIEVLKAKGKMTYGDGLIEARRVYAQAFVDATGEALEGAMFTPGYLAEYLTQHLEHLKVSLKNVGVDIECGACAEVFYTGATTNEHTCSK